MGSGIAMKNCLYIFGSEIVLHKKNKDLACFQGMPCDNQGKEPFSLHQLEKIGKAEAFSANIFRKFFFAFSHFFLYSSKQIRVILVTNNN